MQERRLNQWKHATIRLIDKDKKQSVGQLLNQAGVLKTDAEVKIDSRIYKQKLIY